MKRLPFTTLKSHAWRTKQSGAALIVGLIFLVILTLLGLTAMQTGIMEERMAGNSRDRNLAFQAAEAAMRDAEYDTHAIQPSGAQEAKLRTFGKISGMSGADTNCSEGLCCNPSTGGAAAGLTCIEPTTPVYNRFSSSIGISYGTYTFGYTSSSPATFPQVSKQPQYLIEPFPPQGGHFYYRISAIGYGINSSSNVILQEVYKD